MKSSCQTVVLALLASILKQVTKESFLKLLQDQPVWKEFCGCTKYWCQHDYYDWFLGELWRMRARCSWYLELTPEVYMKKILRSRFSHSQPSSTGLELWQYDMNIDYYHLCLLCWRGYISELYKVKSKAYGWILIKHSMMLGIWHRKSWLNCWLMLKKGQVRVTE